MQQVIERYADRIRSAAAEKTPLRLRGGGGKDFYGQALEGEVLDTRAYAGIIAYEPTELVITVRCGTPLMELDAALRVEGQHRNEPPHFGPAATWRDGRAGLSAAAPGGRGARFRAGAHARRRGDDLVSRPGTETSSL